MLYVYYLHISTYHPYSLQSSIHANHDQSTRYSKYIDTTLNPQSARKDPCNMYNNISSPLISFGIERAERSVRNSGMDGKRFSWSTFLAKVARVEMPCSTTSSGGAVRRCMFDTVSKTGHVVWQTWIPSART